MNVLLIDDNPHIIDMLTIFVKKTAPTDNIYFAYNGNQALEIVCTYKIDLIFTDIQMPDCDGFVMLEKLKEMEIEIPVVIISGFDEFNYARRALKLGAIDYLLKPVSEDTFRSIYFKCSEIAQNAGATQKAKGIENITEIMFSQQHLLANLLQSNLSEELKAQIPTEKYDSAAVFLLEIFEHSWHIESYKKVFFLKTLELLKSLNYSDFMLVQGEHQSMWTLIVLGRSGKLSVFAGELCKKLSQNKQKYGCAKAASIEKIPQNFSQALKSMEEYYFDLAINYEQKDKDADYSKLINQIIKGVINCDINLINNNSDDLFLLFMVKKPLVIDIKRMLSEIVYSIMQASGELISLISSYNFTENDLSQTIQNSASLSQLKSRFVHILLLYVHELDKKKTPENDYTTEKVKQYVLAEYQTDLSISEIAKRLGLHPNYLSSVFKAKTGTTYSKYLKEVRMKNAQLLLCDKKNKTADVSQLVGYTDTSHFSKSFQDYCGVTPSQYQKKYGK